MIQSLFGSTPVPSEPNLLERLKAGIQKTRAGLMEKLEDAVSGRKEIDASVLEELEYALITADIGTKTTSEILERIRQRVERHQVADIAELKNLIREHLLEILQATERPLPPGSRTARCDPGRRRQRGWENHVDRQIRLAVSNPKDAAFCSAPPTLSAPPPSSSSRSGRSAPAPISSANSPVPIRAPSFSTPCKPRGPQSGLCDRRYRGPPAHQRRISWPSLKKCAAPPRASFPPRRMRCCW